MMLSDYKTNVNIPMPHVKISNGKNCRTCNKSSVCKYQEVVVEEVEKLMGEIKAKGLPLSVNVNCREWNGYNQMLVR